MPGSLPKIPRSREDDYAEAAVAARRELCARVAGDRKSVV